MIERINFIQKWIETITTATLGVFSGYFITEIIQTETPYAILLLFPLIFAIILLEKSLDWGLKLVIGNSAKLRKIVAGNHYIEGYWMERLVNVNHLDRPYAYALISISFSDMRYLISGRMIDGELTRCISVFTSNHSDYRNHSLTYYFNAINTSDVGINDIVGRSEFIFVQSSDMPMLFSGKIIDSKNQGLLKVEGKKLNPKTITDFDPDNDEHVIELLRNRCQ